MNREQKLGICVTILCVVLFMLVVLVGNITKDKWGSISENNATIEGTQLENTELENEIEQEENTNSEESEYSNFAIADVNRYVNVRQEPNTESAICKWIYKS